MSKGQSEKDAFRQVESVDVFAANAIFPDASAVFTSRAIPIDEAKDSACIVLDTNALLVPYGISAQTLSQVEATYRRLLAENRLLVPAQVAREFARNRVLKLAELHQKLSRRRSQLQPFQQGSYPLLEGLSEYKRLREVEDDLDRLVNEYRQLIASVVDNIRQWEWNDPVSLLYAGLFSSDVVVEPGESLEDIRKEHLRRFLNKIPPGYKDEAKEDEGIGDLLAWLTILKIGAQRRTSVIFVSGEEKADWWHRSEQQPLYPRFELVDEFRRASGGRSFHIIKFSRLLELFGASRDVVAEVQGEEDLSVPIAPLTEHGALSMRRISAERGVALWLVESGYKISPAPLLSGFDYIAQDEGGEFAVDIAYVSERNALPRLRHLRNNFESPRNGFPVRIIVVSDSQQALERVERAVPELNLEMNLLTGLILADGRFQPREFFAWI